MVIITPKKKKKFSSYYYLLCIDQVGLLILPILIGTDSIMVYFDLLPIHHIFIKILISCIISNIVECLYILFYFPYFIGCGTSRCSYHTTKFQGLQYLDFLKLNHLNLERKNQSKVFFFK